MAPAHAKGIPVPRYRERALEMRIREIYRTLTKSHPESKDLLFELSQPEGELKDLRRNTCT